MCQGSSNAMDLRANLYKLDKGLIGIQSQNFHTLNFSLETQRPLGVLWKFLLSWKTNIWDWKIVSPQFSFGDVLNSTENLKT